MLIDYLAGSENASRNCNVDNLVWRNDMPKDAVPKFGFESRAIVATDKVILEEAAEYAVEILHCITAHGRGFAYCINRYNSLSVSGQTVIGETVDIYDGIKSAALEMLRKVMLVDKLRTEQCRAISKYVDAHLDSEEGVYNKGLKVIKSEHDAEMEALKKSIKL
jgi:hypothetical protein